MLYVSEVHLTNTHFPGAELELSVDLVDAVLTNSDLRHADLTNANLVDTVTRHRFSPC